MKQINLILAIVWAGMAFVIFFVHPTGGKQAGFPVSIGWLAVLFALYNLVRWWGTQVSGGRGIPKRSDWKRPPIRRPGDNREPDPQFMFNEPPPPEEPPPPSENGIQRES